jgi:hypothetical protein
MKTLLLLAMTVPFNPPPSFVRVCGTCHPPEAVIDNRNTRKGWTELVDEMIDKGAKPSAREKREIIAWLAKNFPMKDSN